jgi:hypothetical protein
MINGNFTRTEKVSGDGKEQLQMEERLEHQLKDIKTELIVLRMPLDMDIKDSFYGI